MKIKILLVDDEKEILDILKEWLVLEGFEVLTAQTGREFRKLALAEKPNLIVLDIHLGSDNGPAVYDELLSQGFDRRVPVIFLTGLVSEEAKSRAAAGRTYALHTKPFNMTEIIKDIHCLVGD